MRQLQEGERVALFDKINGRYYHTVRGGDVLWTKDRDDAMKFERLDNVFQSLIRIGRHLNRAHQNPEIELHIIKRQGWVKIGTVTHF